MRRRVFLLSATTALSCARDKRPRLNVYNWSSYIDPATITLFEHERGVRVRYGTYEGNEEMLAKAITGNSGWDVVFPTHSRLAPMARNRLLAPLDHGQLPSLRNLDVRFREPAWDKGLRWGVPYMWNATGIAWNKRQTVAPRGWAALWSPALKGRITMLDDPEDVIGACLQKLGFPFDSVDERQLQAARAEAVAQKQMLRAYLNADVRDQLVAGDVLAAQLWSTTTAQAMRGHGSPIDFVYPEEGYPLYCDCACILRESGRYELAHEFLDFLLRPEIAAANARVADTATANGAAQGLLPRDNVLYPPDDVYARGVWPPALPAAAQRYRDRLWTEIKAA
jgi:spermidine/putrescine transport system substrate-binding protein